MKRNGLLLLVLGFVFFGFMITGCATTYHKFRNTKLTGESEQLLSGTRWKDSADYIMLCESGGKLTFFTPDGKIDKYQSKNASWERIGNTFRMNIIDGSAIFEGFLNETNTRITFTKIDTGNGMNPIQSDYYIILQQ